MKEKEKWLNSSYVKEMRKDLWEMCIGNVRFIWNPQKLCPELNGQIEPKSWDAVTRALLLPTM